MGLNFLILPGIGNSDADHWQSVWEKSGDHFSRIQQDDWDNPLCSSWQQRLEEKVRELGENTLLIAHSLSCLLVPHWAANTALKIAGALLVAPPDPASSNFPQQAASFAHAPLSKLNFVSALAASTNDPYADIDYSRHCASCWGAEFLNIGAAGHINSASGYGVWPQGKVILQNLCKKIESAE